MIFDKPRLLIAESDASRDEALVALCKERGWSYTITTEIAELERLVKNSAFDMVVADIDMPGLNSQRLLGECFKRKPSQLLLVLGDRGESGERIKLLRGAEKDLVGKDLDVDWIARCMEQAAAAKKQENCEQLAYSFVVSERMELRFTCRELAAAQVVSLPVVSRLVEAKRLSEGEGLRLRVAVQEALLNAFEHGNLELDSRWKEERIGDGDRFSVVRAERLNDEKFAKRAVFVSSLFDSEQLKIVVRDEGRGFDTSNIERPDGGNLSCFGRGLKLIKNAVDEVRFGCGGAEITLIKIINRAGLYNF
jgi:anti-sigma regulatory factor (Ser/Thr protein kinase)/DNA-binding NarL/FixJ family response regulator